MSMTSQKLSFVQKEVLIGLLLGDGNLQTESSGKTFRLRISQSEEHKDYVFHLYELFKNLVSSPPIKALEFDERTKKTYLCWSFSTTQQACFRFYGQQFYDKKSGIKKVPKGISRLIKPRYIAYWYMDDGSQKWKNVSKGIRFGTDNFTYNEVKLLFQVLRDKFQLKTSLQKQRGGVRIYVSSDSHHLLHKLIWEHLIPSMRYKFPPL